MAAFNKFTMTDSGRSIEINAEFVEQVRHHSEGDATAIYLTGKSGPIIVHENMAAVMKALKGGDTSPAAKPSAPLRSAKGAAPVKPSPAAAPSARKSRG